MNTRLVSYGIQTEDSDFRIHVCVNAARVYVFKTDNGKRAAASRSFRLLQIKTGDIVTAEGYTVPCDALSAQNYAIPEDLIEHYAISRFDPTSVKGSKATAIAAEMIKRGIILLPMVVREIDNRKAQISGIDLAVNSDVKIQVKCDFLGGHKEYRGTGNLFLQVSECNPWGQH